ncbi:MAG: diaminopimelate decarboxylase, partial [Candidatus Omnitrophica bacterium CG12_big_fil_rev_8_21_14_0_65_42_8]
AKEYAKAVLPVLKKVKANIILEPGRFIAGNAGVLVTRIQYIKETPSKNFAIVDAGMNDLIRPSLYEAYHEILPVKSSSYSCSKEIRVFDVVGPICESGDFLGKDRKFISLREGDLLSVMGAGAYGFSMSSNYNSRPRPAEVMVEGSKTKLIRRRETYEDLIRTEI